MLLAVETVAAGAKTLLLQLDSSAPCARCRLEHVPSANSDCALSVTFSVTDGFTPTKAHKSEKKPTGGQILWRRCQILAPRIPLLVLQRYLERK